MGLARKIDVRFAKVSKETVQAKVASAQRQIGALERKKRALLASGKIEEAIEVEGRIEKLKFGQRVSRSGLLQLR